MNQDEYFSVHAGLTINVEPLSPNEAVPDETHFPQEIPPLFRVASECSGLDDNLDRTLSQFNKEQYQALTQYLAAQNSKINLLLSYVLSQQNDPAFRYTTTTFGASRLSYSSAQPLTPGQAVRLKLFLEQPAAAVYAYAEVCECQALDQQYDISLRYTRLQEEDRDLLIRAALYFQQKILRQRAQQRSDNS
ncbi:MULTISPECIES: PilZ domain-containing protein [Photobacterium]|uniref:PilZ domain-containing protein n=1 Tax=Photobacterium TaxID=657 RepID=UPI001C2D6CFC|nr:MULTISPECIES: PilZ domain-containing protein [Photobacterium]MBV1842951.1 PilZ domain-containing protein [Photobacterium ganghwense]